LPGTIIVSYITPEIISKGLTGIIVIAMVIITSIRTKNTLLALAIGVVSLMLFQNLLN
jgi:uncharacterized membrane protein